MKKKGKWKSIENNRLSFVVCAMSVMVWFALLPLGAVGKLFSLIVTIHIHLLCYLSSSLFSPLVTCRAELKFHNDTKGQ